MQRTDAELIAESRRQSQLLRDKVDRELAFWQRMCAVVDPQRRRAVNR